MKKYKSRTARVRPNIAFWSTASQRQSRNRRFRLVRAFPFKIVLGLFCLYLGYEILTFPFLSLAKLSTDNPTETALMRQRIHEAHNQGKVLKIDHRWTPLSAVPEVSLHL